MIPAVRCEELVEWRIGDRPRPIGVRRLSSRQCFANALRRARQHEWRYVEGYAYWKSSAIHHAWCVDAEGVVVETTWQALGTRYLGRTFSLSKVARWQTLAAETARPISMLSQTWRGSGALLVYTELLFAQPGE